MADWLVLGARHQRPVWHWRKCVNTFRAVNPWNSTRNRRPALRRRMQLSSCEGDFGSVHLGVHSCTPACEPPAPWG